MPSFVLSAAGMREFAKLALRLEAATARLEDIASSTVELPQGVPALQPTLASPQSAASIGSPPAPPPTTALPPVPKLPPEPVPESIEEFDAFLDSSVAKYVGLSKKLGGLVAQQAAKIQQGFQAQRHFLLITTKAKKPDLTGSEMSLYQNLLKHINEALMAVTSIKEQNRGAPAFHNLSAVAEGAMVLAWVTVDNRPYKHVEESMGAAQFFGNRVLKEYRDKYGCDGPASAPYAWLTRLLGIPGKSSGYSLFTRYSRTCPSMSRTTSRTASRGTPKASRRPR